MHGVQGRQCIGSVLAVWWHGCSRAAIFSCRYVAATYFRLPVARNNLKLPFLEAQHENLKVR